MAKSILALGIPYTSAYHLTSRGIGDASGSVLKYSACFASEQLNSTTVALTRVTQKLRRLATELSRPQARFTEQGIRNKIHRWLLDPFVREVLTTGAD